MYKTFVAIMLGCALSLGVIACGGGGPDAGSVDVTVKTTDDFVFAPGDVTVAPGQEVNVTIDNSEGALEHSWVVLNADQTAESAVDIMADGDDDKKYFNLRAQAGETSSESFAAPAEAGTYIVVCEVAGHAAGGMLGTLTVE